MPPLDESEGNSTPEYYKHLRAAGYEDPEAYIQESGFIFAGATPNTSATNSRKGSSSDQVCVDSSSFEETNINDDPDSDQPEPTSMATRTSLSAVARGKQVDGGQYGRGIPAGHQQPASSHGLYHSDTMRSIILSSHHYNGSNSPAG